jgi:DNA-binding response OmpR family regulator
MSATDPTVLLVDDDPLVRGFLADNLIADGFAVVAADTLGEALRRLELAPPDVAVVDVGLPDGSGLELVTRVRAAGRAGTRVDPALPVLVLSGRGEELDRVRGFDRGADDYVVKPFSYPELRRRIEALLRRTGERVLSGLVSVGELQIDPVSRDVRVGGERAVLSQKEFALLLALAAQPTRVFTKEELLRDVWGYRAMGRTRTLDSHACRLRTKLAAAGGQYVVNVWGVGYRLVDGRPAGAPEAAVSPGSADAPATGSRGSAGARAAHGGAAA